METELPKVLIVDDTRTNIQILMQALRDDYKLGVVTSGTKALEYALTNRPDLILLDIMMPEMDGYEVCERLKADARTREIPVVFLTALDEVQDKARGFALGAVDYITKPFEVVEVTARVHTHLQIVQYRRDLEAHNRDLEHARMQLQQRVRELEGRDRLVQVQLSPPDDFSEAFAEIMDVVAQVLLVDRIRIFEPDPSGSALKLTAAQGLGRPGSIADERDLAAAARIPLNPPDLPVAQTFADGQPREGPIGEAFVPIVCDKQPFGVLQVEGLPKAADDRSNSLNTLWNLAREAALVLQKVEMAQALEKGEWRVDDLLKLEGSEGE